MSKSHTVGAQTLAEQIRRELGNYNTDRRSEVSPPFVERITPIIAAALADRDATIARLTNINTELVLAHSSLLADGARCEAQHTRAEVAEAEVKALNVALVTLLRDAAVVLDDAQCVLDTFRQAEAQGYRSRERQYVIDILGRHFPLLQEPTP